MSDAPSLTVSESFKKRADSAAFYEAWVGAVLSRAGLYTVHYPFTIATDHTSIATYGHSWDLDVGGDLSSFITVDVKSLSQTFRTPTDYPFKEVIVCSQANFIKKWPGASHTGRDFLFVSRETGAILWLPIGSPVELGHEVHDKSRNELYKAVKADQYRLKDLTAFIEYVHEKTH